MSSVREKSPIHAAPAWASSLAEDPTYGLTLAKDGLSPHPTWAVQPTVESIIATLKTAISPARGYEARFLHEGAYSKLYEVSFENQVFVMRVSLPVCPRSKTESEVATLEWVYQYTDLPVPRVRAYDSSRNNPLGFEWILMTKIEGKPLSECWQSIKMGSKERLVKQIAAFTAAAFHQPFHEGVGSIYKTTSNSDSRTHVRERAISDQSRGPFSKASDWISTRLRLASSDLTGRLNDMTYEGDRETIKNMSELVNRVERLMPRFFPASGAISTVILTDPDTDTVAHNSEKQPMQTVLCHDSLSLDNMLVDDDGTLRGIIDWQCIPCLPLHESCQFPAFLQQEYDRLKEPVGVRYLIDKDGPPHPAYFRDRGQYELTKLRWLYVREMLEHTPEFVNVWRSETNADLRDYEAAVQNCDNEFAFELVEEWVMALENGRDPSEMPKRLHEQLMR
ncbi:phosphotransferase enzyme family-domain-containing protein [Xylariaceae sp. AK1471]|nr:phosphotransferase enzyme family-domain-containing protein [Xylariaceae sp. AK1471]